MTLIQEKLEKHAKCSRCGKQLQAGDGCITYDDRDLSLALGSCCALFVLSSLIQDAELAIQDEVWIHSISGESNSDKLRRVAKSANGLAERLINWAEVNDSITKLKPT